MFLDPALELRGYDECVDVAKRPDHLLQDVEQLPWASCQA